MLTLIVSLNFFLILEQFDVFVNYFPVISDL